MKKTPVQIVGLIIYVSCYIIFKWTSHGEQELPVLNLTLSGYILGSSFCKHSQQSGRCLCLLMRTDNAYNKFVILCHCQQQVLNTCAVQLHIRDWLSHMMCKQSWIQAACNQIIFIMNFVISKREHYRQIKLYTQFPFSSLTYENVLILESAQFKHLFNSKYPILKERFLLCISNRISDKQ